MLTDPGLSLHVIRGDSRRAAVNFLIDIGTTQYQIACGICDQQITLRVQCEIFPAADLENDLFGIRAGSNDVVGFDLALIAIVDGVDAGIDAAILYATVERNISLPTSGIVSDQVVAMARLDFQTFDFGSSVRPSKANPHDGFCFGFGLWRSKAEDGFPVGEKQCVPISSGKEFDVADRSDLDFFQN